MYQSVLLTLSFLLYSRSHSADIYWVILTMLYKQSDSEKDSAGSHSYRYHFQNELHLCAM